MEAGGGVGGVEASLEPATLSVAPGSVGTATVRVRNTGPAPVTCQLAVATAGVADWAWVAPPELTVEAGATATARLSVKVPAPPRPAAGPVPFEVEVGGGVRCAGVVDVLPVVNVTAAVGPPDVVTVRNQGNTSVTATLEGEGAVVTPPSVSVEPGGTATASIKARAGRSFQVHVRAAGAPPVTAAGSMPRRRLLRPVVILPVALVVVLVAALLARGGGGEPAEEAAQEEPVVVLSGPDDPNCPVQNHLAADSAGLRRIGVPVPDLWSFLEQKPGQPCQPVRFNPCEPLHYVTNSALAPPGALQDLEAAFAQLAAATGMTFVNDGPTDEDAQRGRPAYQEDRYGRRWAPILVVWDHGRPNRLADDNPGGGRAINVNGVYVSAFLVLNVDARDADRRPLVNGFGDGASWGRVMIHELGHVAGLGHVGSPQQVMFDDLGIQRGRAEFHAGDLAGLKALGREAGCGQTPALPPPR